MPRFRRRWRRKERGLGFRPRHSSREGRRRRCLEGGRGFGESRDEDGHAADGDGDRRGAPVPDHRREVGGGAERGRGAERAADNRRPASQFSGGGQHEPLEGHPLPQRCGGTEPPRRGRSGWGLRVLTVAPGGRGGPRLRAVRLPRRVEEQPWRRRWWWWCCFFPRTTGGGGEGRHPPGRQRECGGVCLVFCLLLFFFSGVGVGDFFFLFFFAAAAVVAGARG